MRILMLALLTFLLLGCSAESFLLDEAKKNCLGRGGVSNIVKTDSLFSDPIFTCVDGTAASSKVLK